VTTGTTPLDQDADDAKRPTTLLLVYTWDILLAIGALIEVFAPFAGGVEVAGKTVDTPLVVQILVALSNAAFAGALILIGTLLTRHDTWVRRAQIVVLSMAGGIRAVTFVIDSATGHTLDVGGMLGILVILLIDVLAIYALTSARVVAWFRDPGPVPAYIGALIAFWAAVSVAFFALRSLS